MKSTARSPISSDTKGFPGSGFHVNDIPVSVISILFSIMLLLSVITDTVGLMKSLYLSRDNSVLLTYPATPSLIFLSKLVTYYVYELRKSFMFTVPMFIAYGINVWAIDFFPVLRRNKANCIDYNFLQFLNPSL